jgi:hypothetical protein
MTGRALLFGSDSWRILMTPWPRLLVVLLTMHLVSILASPAVSAPGLSEYVILAAGRVEIGGGSRITGLVGAGFTGAQNQRAVLLNAGGDVEGDVRSAWHVQLNNGCFVIGNVYHPAGTQIFYGNPAGVGGDIIADPELPSLPVPTAFTSGGTSYTGLGNGAILTLVPGSYGVVALGGGCTLNLEAGNYYFDELSAGNGLNVFIQLNGGEIGIYVTGKVSFGSADSHVSGGTSEDVYLESHWVATGTQPFGFKAAAGSEWAGDVYTPTSGIHYGGSAGPTVFFGRFIAGTDVDIEHGVTNNPPVPVEATTWGSIKNKFRE